jgi:hypothetical protein
MNKSTTMRNNKALAENMKVKMLETRAASWPSIKVLF